ncbi:unnamed protein product, partial [Prorocentrum cordatum]
EEIERHCPSGPREAADGDVCPICLEEAVPDEVVRKLQCGHVVHKECCEAWLATADACPMCRSQVQRFPFLHMLTRLCGSDSTNPDLQRRNQCTTAVDYCFICSFSGL